MEAQDEDDAHEDSRTVWRNRARRLDRVRGRGIDLTAGACGNNAGSTNEAGAIDCAGGGSVTLLAMFQPAEDYSDVANGYVLTGIDGILDMQVNGVLATGGSAAFWDWDQVNGCNPAAFSANRKAPTTGCTATRTRSTSRTRVRALRPVAV
jgi:hypothetical protein